MVRLKRIKDQERSSLSLTLDSSHHWPCENVYISSCLFPLLETNFLAWFAAEKDTSKGAGWERFDFDKDAPLDDEEVEEGQLFLWISIYTPWFAVQIEIKKSSYDYAGTDDDAALVKRMAQSFRFNAIEVWWVIIFHCHSVYNHFQQQSHLQTIYMVYNQFAVEKGRAT